MILDPSRYGATHRAGRCANAAEHGRGSVLHAVRRNPFEGVGPALCGAEPGARSAGWSCTIRSLDCVSCPRCRALIKAAAGAAA